MHTLPTTSTLPSMLSAVTCLRSAHVADNFVEDILGDFKFEVASPYILYRSKSDEVLHPTRTQTLKPASRKQVKTAGTTCRLSAFGSMMKMKAQWYQVYCSE